MAATNLAASCSYTVSPAPSATYPDTGGAELTNGSLPSTSTSGYADAGWVGWQNTDATIVIDLGSSKSFDHVNVYQHSHTSKGIWVPSSISVLGSNDNSNFTALDSSTTIPQAPGWFVIPITSSTAYQYVKVVCARTPAKEWMFLGEIQVAAAGDVDDEYTVALLHFDGSDSGIVFSDEANTAIERFGDSQTKTAIKKFGTASGYFDGNGDAVYLGNSPEFDFGSGDFTVDWWEYRTSNANAKTTIARHSNTCAFLLGYSNNGTNILCYMSSNGTSWDIASAKIFGAVELNAWHHFAVCRSGNNFYLFRDGVAGDSWTSSAALYAGVSPLQIGRFNNVYFAGYIDELRISKGIARWTSEFTPPSTPYGGAAPGIMFATFI